MMPLQICYRNFPPSDAMNHRIEGLFDKLDPKTHRIEFARVVIEQPHRHRAHGREFSVRLELKIPGKDIVLNRHPRLDAEDTRDVYHFLTELFEAAAWQLRRRAHRRVALRHRVGVSARALA
jgi:hypothetical protein